MARRKKKLYEVTFVRRVYSTLRVRAWSKDDAVDKADLYAEEAHFERDTEPELFAVTEVPHVTKPRSNR